MKRSKTTMLSLLLVAACMTAGILGARASRSEQGFSLGDFSGIQPLEAVEVFEQDPTNENLVHLLKALCYWAQVEGDEDVQPLIAEYGSLFYERVREEEADPSELGSDEEMMELLRWIDDYGAKRLP